MLARNFRDFNGQQLSDEANRYLDHVRDRGWIDAIRRAFERADELRILFVGETIIDEYRYVAPLAKPSKEFILATVECREPERFLGGVVAASLHADWRNVSVVTNDGEPLRKTRFVEDGTARKVFEVYSKPRLELSEEQQRAFQVKAMTESLKADVVVVFDFGHGLMDATARNGVEFRAKFLAVNAQTNAGNYGFNPVTKYTNVDLVCVDLPEARLACGDQLAEAPELADELDSLTKRLHHVAITQGRHGCYAGGQHIPAFSSHPTDTMGAGDAFLAVAAPLVAAGLDLEAAAFVGNVAGAIKTDIVGHRRHVERGELIETIEELLR